MRRRATPVVSGRFPYIRWITGYPCVTWPTGSCWTWSPR